VSEVLAYIPPSLALITVLGVDRLTRLKGLQPPGFHSADLGPSTGGLGRGWYWCLSRRALALAFLWGVFWVGIFYPLGTLGQDQTVDLSQVDTSQLFLLHLLFVVALFVWYVLGFAGLGAGSSPAAKEWRTQFGFRTDSIGREIGIGLIAGVGAWMVVLGALLALGLALWAFGGEEALPTQPPAMIPWIAALPIGIRLAVSLSAGVVEETFFRGFLQPRVGILLSTALFALAHASYEQPMMLVGVTLLSVVYGLLVKWRQNIWPAITAHFLFDAVQLTIVIPRALELLPAEGGEAVAPLARTAVLSFAMFAGSTGVAIW